MKTTHLLSAALLAAGLLVHIQPDGTLGMPQALAQDGVRAEIGQALNQASALLRAGKGREALAKVHETDSISGKTPVERLTIDRMRGAAAQRAGDHGQAVEAFEAVMATGKLSGSEQAQTAEALAYSYSQQRSWSKTEQWAQRAIQLGGNTAQMRQLIAYVNAQTGDYSAVARDSAAAVAAAENAGRKPGEDDLLRLADAQQRTNNAVAYGQTLEKLLSHYPKKQYWSSYLVRLQRKPGFSGRLLLDIYRLQLATGNLDSTNEVMEAAQLALQAGLPAEAKRIIDKGYASGLLGKGEEAARHKRLQDLANKMHAEITEGLAETVKQALAAKDGNVLVQSGTVYVTMGEAAKGVDLISKGIAAGNLKRPEEAKLRLGMGQLQDPKSRDKAAATLRAVQGSDGTPDIARLWLILGSGK